MLSLESVLSIFDIHYLTKTLNNYNNNKYNNNKAEAQLNIYFLTRTSSPLNKFASPAVNILQHLRNYNPFSFLLQHARTIFNVEV